ncbi:hypothetical protein ACU686_40980 [Yinghuangia aomiensis]
MLIAALQRCRHDHRGDRRFALGDLRGRRRQTRPRRRGRTGTGRLPRQPVRGLRAAARWTRWRG